VIAHDIRNPSTRQFQAASSLTARHRWCLTGTPIQNSLDDLGALITFLKVPLLQNAATFQRFIVNQSKPGVSHRFKNLRTLLESICIRRTKEKIGLSDPTEHIRKLTFTPPERTEYNELLRRYETLQNLGVSGHSKRGETAKVQSFLRLRLFCNNGSFSTGLSDMNWRPDELLSYLQQIDQAVCSYCDRTIYDLNDVPGTDGGCLLGQCLHLVCRDCQTQHQAEGSQCPKCTSETEIPGQGSTAGSNSFPVLQESGIRMLLPTTRYPTKLLAFLEDIRLQLARKRYERYPSAPIPPLSILTSAMQHCVFSLDQNA
jgi:SWI/SNF-related matrix-associated actin-dependent regulator of chromatin subfamily A3